MFPVDRPTTPIVIKGNVHNIVADHLREMILSGRLNPGDRLRREELASTLGVSATPVREALRQLHTEGLVVFYPRRGAVVARLSLSEFEEIYRIKEELESQAFRWAAEDFNRIQIGRLRQILESIEEIEVQFDVSRHLELSRDFIFAIVEASGKQYLIRLLSSIWDISQQYRRQYVVIEELRTDRLQHYRNIYLACVAQDADALIRSHRDAYALMKETLIPRLRESEGEFDEPSAKVLSRRDETVWTAPKRNTSRKDYTPEQIVNKLRDAEVKLSQGQTVEQVCSAIEISAETLYQWRSESGGAATDQAKRRKDLEHENDRLRQAIADLTLDNQILKEAAREALGADPPAQVG